MYQVNSCATEREKESDAEVTFIYTSKEAHALSSSKPRSFQAATARPLAVFSHGHTSRGALLLSRQREAATLQLHNRRPRCKVHLTSQIHNSLTLCICVALNVPLPVSRTNGHWQMVPERILRPEISCGLGFAFVRLAFAEVVRWLPTA